MSTHYVKLYGTIITSSVWAEDSDTKVLWVTMLAMADADGVVRASVPGLARFAGVSIEATERALEKFEAPDPYSTTPDDEGRRIRPVLGGWAVINHQKYRDAQTPTQAKWAEKKARQRAKTRGTQGDMSPMSPPYTNTNTNTDTDTEDLNTPLPPKGGKRKKKAKTESDASPALTAIMDEVREGWNHIAETRGWPKCTRRPKGEPGTLLEARCKDPEWLADYREGLRLMARLDWMKDAKFITFLRADSLRKLLDGEWKPTKDISTTEDGWSILDDFKDATHAGKRPVAGQHGQKEQQPTPRQGEVA